MVFHRADRAVRQVDLLQVGQLQRHENVPLQHGQIVVAQIQDLRVLVDGRDGGERAINTFHRLLPALPLAGAGLGAIRFRSAELQEAKGQEEEEQKMAQMASTQR